MSSYSDPIVNAAVYEDLIYHPSGDTFQYRLESPLGNVLMRGEISERPDGTRPQLYFNRLCEPFLSMELDPTVTGFTQHTGACKRFYIVDDSDDSITATYTPIRMYSGYYACETGIGGQFIPDSRVLSDPIKPSVSKDMYLPLTVFNGYSGQTYSGQTLSHYALYLSTSATDPRIYFYGTDEKMPWELINVGRSAGNGLYYVGEYRYTIPADRTEEYNVGINGATYYHSPWYFDSFSNCYEDNSDGLMSQRYRFEGTYDHYHPYGNFYFSPTRNTTGRERQYTLTIRHKDTGELIAVIKIIQEA